MRPTVGLLARGREHGQNHRKDNEHGDHEEDRARLVPCQRARLLTQSARLPIVPLAEITVADLFVGWRYRQDLGDIDGLAESIQKHGLLRPVAIDDDNGLVYGLRRLRTYEKLGRESIPAYQYGPLTEKEIREMQLAENTWLDYSGTEPANVGLGQLVGEGQ